MRFRNVSISALAYVLPNKVLTSQKIEEDLSPLYEQLSCSSGKLEDLTGIKERRVWPIEQKASDVASLAGKRLLEEAEIDKRSIDLLVHCGVCRDYLEPATASVIHHHLGLDPHCMVFDLSNACVGFLNALLMAGSMIESGQVKRALVVTGENSGPIYEPTISGLLQKPSESTFRNALASLTLGSAAVAYLLEPTSSAGNQKPKLLGGIYQADSSAHNLCRGTGSHEQGFMMQTDTYQLMKSGLALSKISWELCKRELDWENETPDHFITHQISLAHQKKVFETLCIDAAKGYTDIDWLGNTGSAAAPLSLILRKENDSLKPKDKIAMLGIGSGLNTVMLGIQW